MNAYNFFYWGPLLFKIKLQSQDLKKCAELCSKKSSEVNDELVGVIKHEHYVSTSRYFKIIEPYLNSFRHGYEKWYGKPLTQAMIVNRAWANFMTAGEWNPPHRHSNCDLSSVLFVKIPKKLKEERKAFSGVGEGPGAISFTFGETRPHSISCKGFEPAEGDFFIFPANLTHFVAPFKCTGERISVSANFRLEFGDYSQ